MRNSRGKDQLHAFVAAGANALRPRVHYVVTAKCWQIRLTLESAEVDTRANGAIQVVGKPSDTAPDGTIEIHLVHPIERCVRKMSKVPSQESSAEKAVVAECAVGSVVGQRHEAPHVAEMEFGKRTVLAEVSDETACKEDGLLSSHLGSRWKRPSVHARKA